MAEFLQLLGAVKSWGDDAQFRQHAEILDQHARIINELNATVTQQSRTIALLDTKVQQAQVAPNVAFGLSVAMIFGVGLLMGVSLLVLTSRLERQLKQVELKLMKLMRPSGGEAFWRSVPLIRPPSGP